MIISKNKKGELVFPLVNSKKQVKVTATAKHENYAWLDIQSFLINLSNGNYDEIGRIKMVNDSNNQENGFAIRHLNRNELAAYLEKICSSKKEANPPTFFDELDDIENYSKSFESIPITERHAVIKSRIGQGVFRELLIQHWGGCSVTGVDFLPILRASHIKPWSVSSNEERLDPENGLLLTPNLDVAFDRGFISFSDDGKILISSELSEKIQADLGIYETMKLRKISSGNIEHLIHHRNFVFKN